MKKLLVLAFAAAATACGPSVASIVVDPAAPTLGAKGQTVVLKADPRDKEGKTVQDAILKVTWESQNPDLATVDKGVVTAKKSGDAKIVAKVGEIVGSATIKVQIAASMVLEPASSEIVGVGKTVNLTAVVKDEAGRPIPGAQPVWSTSDSNVVNIKDGVVTAAGAGKAKIKGALGEITATADFSVSHPKVAKLAISPESATLEKVGEVLRLKALLTDDAGAPILGLEPKWTTSDDKIVSVSDTGQIQSVKKGKAKIKAVSGDATAEIEVMVLGGS
ncbi:MAG: Ig-like domain-containing protein [Myxococcota bacterium]